MRYLRRASTVSASASARSMTTNKQTNKQTKKPPWPESASELYRPSDRRLSDKLVPTFADRECRVVSVTDPYDHNLGFPHRSHYFFFQVSSSVVLTRLSGLRSRPITCQKSGSAGNRSRTSGSVAGTLTTRPQRRSFLSK
jgi:hypothetical protein